MNYNTMINDDQNGTPIHTLKKHLNNIGYVPQQMNQMQQLQQLQRIQQMKANEQIQQQQMQMMAAHMKNTKSLQDEFTVTDKYEQDHLDKQADISHLVSDINKSLDNYSPSNQDIPPKDDSEEEEVKDEDINQSRSYLPDWFKEMLLILIIYIILSQNLVKGFFGKYIKYINPANDGNVPFIGIVIYGIILAVIYIVLKKLFIN